MRSRYFLLLLGPFRLSNAATKRVASLRLQQHQLTPHLKSRNKRRGQSARNCCQGHRYHRDSEDFDHRNIHHDKGRAGFVTGFPGCLLEGIWGGIIQGDRRRCGHGYYHALVCATVIAGAFMASRIRARNLGNGEGCAAGGETPESASCSRKREPRSRYRL